MSNNATAQKTKEVTFWCPRHDGFQYFFTDRKAELFHTAGGHERWKRHPRSKAEFKPELGDGRGGWYRTSDPDEIEDLKTCPDVVVFTPEMQNAIPAPPVVVRH